MSSRDIKDLLKELQRKGWLIEKNRKHYKAWHPDGGLICLAATPSCHHAIANIRGEVKKLEKQHAAGTWQPPHIKK